MRRREHFRIRKYARRYDRKTGRFIIDIAYETAAPERTHRVVSVAEGFGLGLDQWEKFVIYDNVELKIGSTDITYITGDSGSGKSARTTFIISSPIKSNILWFSIRKAAIL